MEGTTTNSTASSEGLNQSDQRQSGGNANGSSDDGTGDEQQQHRQQESETNENEDKDISSSDKAKPATSTAAASSSSSLSGAVAAGTQPTTTKATPSIAALNVYKRVAIIRGSNDVLTYEEPDGTVKSITDLHLAAVATTPLLQKPKPKDDIPVPTIKSVDTYQQDIKADYDIKTSYVRYTRPSHKELQENVEYVVDAEDEEWLLNNTKFGGSIASATIKSLNDEGGAKDAREDANDDELTTYNVQVSSSSTPPTEISMTTELPLDMFEIMLDVLEKATGFEMIVPIGQAQDIILERLPQLYQMYPIKAPRNRNGAGSGILEPGTGTDPNSGVGSSSSGATPAITIRHVTTDVYQYWMSKRSKLKRPLLRRFWPVTSTEDTNPHLVFRPREKEKYKLRKKRQNDMDSYRKLQQLKEDFSQIRLMLSMVRQREELNRSLVDLQQEWFEQKLYDAVDTSGLCRISRRLDRKSLDQLMQVESHYDIHDTIGSGGRRKKQQLSRRGSGSIGIRNASRSTSPVPESSSINFGLPSCSGGVDSSGNDERPPMKVAGSNHGEPAPNFLHPLSTRERYATSWEGCAPHVTTFVNSQQEQSTHFRHRPRIGRGGRVVIDRLPIPDDPNFPPNTYFIAGHAPPSSSTIASMIKSQIQQKGPQYQPQQQRPTERLLDLLPPPLDHNELSRRIENICLTALQEEYNSMYQAASTSRGFASIGGTGVGGLSSTAGYGGVVGGGSHDDVDENDGRAIVVSMKDWLDTDDQLWGEERYAIGPI